MDRQEPDRRDKPSSIRLTGTEQHEHDTLAELFLGDAPFAPSPMSVSSSSDADQHPNAVRHGDDAPKPAGEVSLRYDGSAIRAPSADDSRSSGIRRPIVEMVVLGHLPVRASLWVRQYACQSARKRSETVALLRTAGDSVALDLITGGERAEIEPLDNIEDAMTVVTNAAGRIVVRVDETAEPELLERAGIDELTILTGADETAVVASYRLIKSLVSAVDNGLDPEEAPLLRVAVMGGSGDDIAAACAKIGRACKAFLGRPIEILDASGRIDATGTTSVCRLDRAGLAAEAIDALLSGAQTGVQAEAVATGLRLADSDAFAGAPAPETLPDGPEIVVLPAAAEGLGLGSDAGSGLGPGSEVEAKPTPRRPDASGDRVGADADRPAVRLGVTPPELIEGLEPLETRCPSARDVWFAADGDGALHAVAMDEGDSPVAALVAAGGWAMQNLALLLRAEPGLAMPSAKPGEDAGIGLHLLTTEPKRWRSVLDSDVSVYAVAVVNAAGKDHMIATALNEPFCR